MKEDLKNIKIDLDMYLTYRYLEFIIAEFKIPVDIKREICDIYDKLQFILFSGCSTDVAYYHRLYLEPDMKM